MMGRDIAAGAFGLLLLAACAPSAPLLVSPEERERYERRRLAMAGFETLEALAGRGIEVQRVDPMWGLQEYPSVELRRDASGQVTISLNFWGHTRTVIASSALWERFAARSEEAFAEPDRREAMRRDRQVTRRSGYCHSWHVLELSAGGQFRRITATPCYGDLQATSLAYAEDLARAAIEQVDVCQAERQVVEIAQALWQCGRHFGGPTPEHRLIVDTPTS
jgi:hypothetical protein